MIKVASTAQETLKELRKGDTWASFWQEGVQYAEKRINQEIWFGVKGAKGGVPPDCKMGVDIVDLVIKKILSGRLTCKPNVDFTAFFYRTIRTEVRLLARSKKNLDMISDQTGSGDTRKNFSMFDINPPDPDEHNSFYTKYSDEFIQTILNDFLAYVSKDPLLTKVSKIFVYSGVVFEECFEGMVEDAGDLIFHLTKQGYINVEGEVQYKFWKLTNEKDFKLPERFNAQRKMIFLIINQSLNIERPKEIASWLNLDAGVIYTVKQKMNRYIERFRDLIYKGEYDG